MPAASHRAPQTGAKIMKVTVSIPHVVWRNGRPRFSPGPKIRRLGFAGSDLKNDDGSWMDLNAAAAWARAKQVEIDQARHKRRGASHERQGSKQRGGPIYTIEDLFEDYFRSPRLAGKTVEDGKRRQRPLSPATIRDYRGKKNALRKYDPDLWGSAVAALDQPILVGLYEELWRDKGLSMARGMIAVLSAAITWGMRRGKVRLAANPARDLGMEMPAPRVRAGEPDEMRALVAAADAIGRPEIGDAVMLALWTGQRQNDRLALAHGGEDDAGRRVFRQSKTGAIVAIPKAPELEARLAAAMLRRQAVGNVVKLDPHVVLDEQVRRPFKPDHYRHVFADVRAAAILTCPSLADFQERDLRDTAVTWLARAGCTIPEICSITGHSLASATTILKHYLADHPELADSAIAKMIAWYGTKGGTEQAG